MKHNTIDYIEFSATDIETTKKFYTETFGWKFTDYGPDYVAFEDGKNTGGFAKADKITPSSPLIVLYSEHLEQTKVTVEENGGKIIKDIYEFPGGRRFHFEDPNGNELAVWSE